MKTRVRKLATIAASMPMLVFVLSLSSCASLAEGGRGTSEHGDGSWNRKVLIAAVSSPFKDRVVDQVIDRLNEKEVYVRIIPLGKLGKAVEPSEYRVIVLVSTVKMGALDRRARGWIAGHPDGTPVVLFSSCGGKSYPDASVDAVTAASDSSASEAASRLLALIEKRL